MQDRGKGWGKIRREVALGVLSDAQGSKLKLCAMAWGRRVRLTSESVAGEAASGRQGSKCDRERPVLGETGGLKEAPWGRGGSACVSARKPVWGVSPLLGSPGYQTGAAQPERAGMLRPPGGHRPPPP